MTRSLLRPLNRLRESLRDLWRDQTGQSLVVVLLSMGVVLGVSAIAIDVASWYQKHHQAQVTADAAALAGANCLANAGTNQPCTSDLDVTAAKQMAVNYAKKNGLTIQMSSVSVDTSTDTVRVRATTGSPAFLARVFGISSATVSAASTANFKSSIPCSQAAGTAVGTGGCAAIYAGNSDPSCAAGTGIDFGTSGGGGANVSVTGVIHSEGLMQLPNTTSASGFTVAQQTTDASGNTTGCYTSGSTLPSGQGGNNALTASEVQGYGWPLDYRNYFTSCSTTGSPACISLHDPYSNTDIEVPSYCTSVTTDPTNGFTFTSSNAVSANVYCSIGTGKPNDPSTWNGPIVFQTSVPSTGSCSNVGYMPATYIGGTIYWNQPSGVLCLKPASGLPAGGENLLFYATGPDLQPGTLYCPSSATSTCANIMLRQKLYWLGDIFDPNGTIQLGTLNNGGNSSGGDFTSTGGMLEGLNVNILNVSVTMTGDGPVTSGGGGTPSGSLDTLVN